MATKRATELGEPKATIVKTSSNGSKPTDAWHTVENIPSNAVRLDTGDYVDQAEFNKLTPPQQAYVKKYGIEAFNREQESVVTEAKAANRLTEEFIKQQETQQSNWYSENIIEVGPGRDPMLKSQYGKLEPKQQDLLRQLGIDAFNAEMSKPKSGEQVFKSMQSEGRVSKDAVYTGYDKNTGQVSYEVPSRDIYKPLTGEEAFKQLLAERPELKGAKFISYNKDTGEVSYEAPPSVIPISPLGPGLAATGVGSSIPPVVPTGIQAFNQLLIEKKIPTGSKFISYNSATGEVTYTPPVTPVEPPKLKGEIFGVPVPKFLESGIIKASSVINLIPSMVTSMSKTPTVGKPWSLTQMKTDALQGAKIFVPGVWAVEASKMETWEIVANAAVDLLFIGLLVTPNVIKTVKFNVASEVAKAVKESGVALKVVDSATMLAKSTAITSEAYTGNLVVLREANRASIQADLKFLEKLRVLNKVTPTELGKLEKYSGMTGLKDSIMEVITARNAFEKALNAVDRATTELGRTKAITAVDSARLEFGKAIEKYVEIARPREVGYRTPTPETPILSTGVEEVETGLYWLPKEVPITEKDLFGAIDDYLRGEKGIELKPTEGGGGGKGYGSEGQWSKAQFDAEVARTKEINAREPKPWELEPKVKTSRVAVAEREVAEAKPTVEMDTSMKPITEERIVTEVSGMTERETAEAAKFPKVDVGAKTSVFPGIHHPKVKVSTPTKTETVPSEEFGRMTSDQIAQRYGDRILVQAIGVPLSQQSTTVNTVGDVWLSPDEAVEVARKISEEATIRSLEFVSPAQAIEAVVQAAIRAGVQSIQKVGTRESVSESVKTRINELNKILTNPITKTELQTKTQTVVEVAIKAVQKVEVKTGLERGIVEKTGLKTPFFPWPGGTSGVDRLGGGVGAVLAWKQGFGYWVINWPYMTREDAYFTRTKPAGVKLLKGWRSAYKTITTLTGDAPRQLFLDLGIMDIEITSGNAIRFTQDRQQRSTSGIALGGPKIMSMKLGREV